MLQLKSHGLGHWRIIVACCWTFSGTENGDTLLGTGVSLHVGKYAFPAFCLHDIYALKVMYSSS